MKMLFDYLHTAVDRISELFSANWGSRTATHEKLDRDESVMGNARYTDVTLPGLSVFGELHFRSLTITRDLSVAGDARGTQLICGGTFSIMGEVDISEVTLSGLTSITGSGSISQGALTDLTLRTESFTLNSVTVRTITVKQVWPHAAAQTLVLTGSTVVNAGIIFEAEGGIVELHEGASLFGHLVNGAVVRK